jgi:hypothetical protein
MNSGQNGPRRCKQKLAVAFRSAGSFFAPAAQWIDRVDPGTHRRIKGLRLVTAYAVAAMLGTMADIARGLPDRTALPALAGGFALWASVSEGRVTRAESSRDLLLLSAAAALGAASFVLFAAPLAYFGPAVPELILVGGAFLVGYLRRFGLIGMGIGSQIYIGQLLAYTAPLGAADMPTVLVAGLIAILAAVVPRVLSGPAELPPPIPAALPISGALPPELVMGLQAATAALIVVAMNAAIGLVESAWAITASTYVITGTASGTIERAKRRIIGTVIGVVLGLACLPLTTSFPLAVWALAGLAMVVYAMALPERYDIACGAFAFTLVVTLAIGGVHSVPLLAARTWETLLGGALGIVTASILFPLRPAQPL